MDIIMIQELQLLEEEFYKKLHNLHVNHVKIIQLHVLHLKQQHLVNLDSTCIQIIAI